MAIALGGLKVGGGRVAPNMTKTIIKVGKVESKVTKSCFNAF